MVDILVILAATDTKLRVGGLPCSAGAPGSADEVKQDGADVER
jgi:hypothetical protein